MCINQGIMHVGDRKVAVQCRKCTECYSAKRRFWIGRILAELQTNANPWFVTLTYSGGYDNPDAYQLDYYQVRTMFKRLRYAGYKFKYICVGEYGEKKQRSHWHILFLWEGEAPPIEFDTQPETPDDPPNWEFWPYGHTNAQKPRSLQATATYIMSYLSKDQKHKTLIKMSKRPAIGEEYLLQYARDHADAGLALFAQSDRYTIPGNLNKDGKNFYYPVDRKTSMYEKMLDAYINHWAKVRPGQRIALSEDVTDYLSDLAQNTNNCEPHTQQYFIDNYDIHPTYDPPRQRQTIYTLDDHFTVICGPSHVELQHHTNEGKPLWRKRVQKDVTHDLTMAVQTAAQVLIDQERKTQRYLRMLNSEKWSLRLEGKENRLSRVPLKLPSHADP